MSEYPSRAVAIIAAEYLEGATLEEVAESMCDLANNMGCYVKFTFEGIEMTVGFHHLPELIIEEWTRRKAAPVLVEYYVEDKPTTIAVRRGNDKGYPDIEPLKF